MADNRSYLGQGAVTVAANGVMAIVSLTTGTLAARLLGVAGRGELAAIQNWSMFFASIGMLGLFESAVYFGSRDRGRAGDFAMTAVGGVAAIGVPVVAVAWAVMPVLLPAQSEAVVLAARLNLLLLYVYALNGFSLSVARSLQKVGFWNFLRTGPPLLWLALLVVAWRSGGASAPGLAVAALVLTGLFAVVTFCTAWRSIVRGARCDRRLVPPMISYGMPLLLATFVRHLNARGDQLVIASLLGAETLGIYAVAATLSFAITPVSSALSAVLFPRVAGEPDRGRRRRTILEAVAWSSACLAAGSAALVVASPFLVPALFGKAFAEAVIPSQILAVAGFFSGVNEVLTEALKGLGASRIILVAESGGLVVTALLLWLLLKDYRAVGAAVASLGAYMATTAALSLQLWMALGRSPEEVI